MTDKLMGRDAWNETMRDELGETIWFWHEQKTLDLAWFCYCKGASLEACGVFLRIEYVVAKEREGALA